MLRFFTLFVVLLAVLFGLELTPWAQAWFVIPWTNALAAISTWIVTLFDSSVVATGKIMSSNTNGFSVSIEAGCNGVEATLVLLAAMLAFPAPWKHKVVGLAIGILAVQLLNIMRVISLFYLGQWNYDVFEWAHLYVWQALIMLDVLVVWLIWVRRVPRIDDSRGPPTAPTALATG
jgi:exosortase H (IPTLxxWG-CTERM-specific)